MAGYGGQDIALDAETPTEFAQGTANSNLTAAQAATARVQSQLAQATLPAEVALRNSQSQLAQQTLPADVALRNQAVAAGDIANAQSSLTLSQNQAMDAYAKAMGEIARRHAEEQSSPLATASAQTTPVQPLFDPKIQQVMQSIDPNDPAAAAKFDAGMKAIEGGVPEASQFIGNYSRGALSAWRSQIGSHAIASAAPPSPLAGGAPSSPNSPLGTPGAALASPLAATGAPSSISPITGQVDPILAEFGGRFPKQASEYLAMQGQIKYQQTGDINYLKQYDPEFYDKVTSGIKNMSDAQATSLKTQASVMGQDANGVLSLIATKGVNSPEVRSAYDTAVMRAAAQGWITPRVAQQELSGPVDSARLAMLGVQSQTVTDFMNTSGQTEANQARARAANPTPHFTATSAVDASGAPFVLNEATGALTAAPTGSGSGLSDFVAKVIGNESGGNPTAQNPRSSASGMGQLTDDTWRNVVAANHPEMVGNKTAAQIKADPVLNARVLALKTDPSQAGLQREAVGDLAQTNAVALAQAGVPVTGASLGVAHALGAQGAIKFANTPVDTPLSKILSPAEMTANPTWKNYTVGDFEQLMTARYGAQPIGQSSGTINPGGQLTPDAIDYVAQQYVRTGELPRLGMGAQGTRQRDLIINRAQQIEAETGATGDDAVTRHATIKAASASLGVLQKQEALVQAYEGTAQRNADLVLQLAPQGGGTTGSPVLNRWIQAGRQNIAGDPNVASFNNAIGTLADEYAKVMSGGTGSQGATDSSRTEAYRRLNASSSPAQLESVITTMRQEMGNRISSMEEERGHLEDTIRGRGVPPSGTPVTAPPASVHAASGVPGATQAQTQAVRGFYGSTAPAGTQGSPYVTVNKGQYDRLPVGAWYIDPNGKTYQKRP